MERVALVEQVSPEEAYAGLRRTPDSALVDVRTKAEWAFVGLPDLRETGRTMLTVEWIDFPSMSPNRQFYEALEQASGGTLPATLYFICRSGSRSLAAARLVAERAEASGQSIRCINVREGFEGDLDSSGHRSSHNGWKATGLPWRQS